MGIARSEVIFCIIEWHGSTKATLRLLAWLLVSDALPPIQADWLFGSLQFGREEVLLGSVDRGIWHSEEAGLSLVFISIDAAALESATEAATGQ